MEETMKYIKPETLFLKNNPNFSEKWVQDRIAEDPAILGLGDLVLRDRERPQPNAGRLDLLFQDAEQSDRYEVEVQLGPTDESHIIRTIEYWDIEHKRYPQYEHHAVIVAEDITSRFLNVINLFNGSIPLIALQMRAMKFEDNVTLVFTKVIDELKYGLEEEEGPVQDVDRAYWETIKGTPSTVKMADELLEIIKKLDSSLALKYTKFYIGLARNNQADNFVIFRPKKNRLNVEIKLEKSDEIQNELDESGIELLDYNNRSGRYKIRLIKSDINKYEALLTKYFKMAYEKTNPVD
jgi:predicted transport protein